MKFLDPLTAKVRVRAEAPLLLVMTRRCSPASDQAVAHASSAARDAGIEAFAFDVDDRDAKALLTELGVTLVPMAFVLRKGLVLDRSVGFRDAKDARDFVASSLGAGA